MTGIYQESSNGFIIGPIKILDHNYIKSILNEELNGLRKLFDEDGYKAEFNQLCNVIAKYKDRVDLNKNKSKYYIKVIFKKGYYNPNKRHSIMSILSYPHKNHDIHVYVVSRRINIEDRIKRKVVWIKDDQELQFILKNKLLLWIFNTIIDRSLLSRFRWVMLDDIIILSFISIYYELENKNKLLKEE